MRLARSVVAGLVVGVLAGFAVALLRPREIGSSQPVAPARQPGRDAARASREHQSVGAIR